MPSVPTWIQNPAAVGVPAFSAQKAAMRVWSAVRVSDISRISRSAAVNGADPNAGGGADRNWLCDVRNQVVAAGSCPPAIVGGVVLLIQIPGPVGMVPVKALVKPSARALVTISPPTARPISVPRTNQGCGSPGPALACDVTRSSNVCAAAGNRYVNTTADA